MVWYYSRAANHAGGLDAVLARMAADNAHNAPVLLLRSWPDAQPLFWALVATWQLLAVQTLLVAALLWELTAQASLLPVQLPPLMRLLF